MQSNGRKRKHLIDIILNLIYPPKCIGCGEVIDYDSDDFMCASCRIKWEEHKNEICRQCGQPIKSCWCGVRENIGEVVDGEVHLVQYDSDNILIHNVIYGCKKTNIKGHFSGMAAEFYNELYPRLPKGDYIVTNVPRSKAAKRKYGHDQSYSVAKEFCDLSGLELIQVLYHVGHTLQKTLTQAQREDNAQKSYKIKNGIADKVKGKNIILIDDVVTTGSSVVRCAKLLKSKGAKRVYVMCIAKTVK